jgi:hypothetical protein
MFAAIKVIISPDYEKIRLPSVLFMLTVSIWSFHKEKNVLISINKSAKMDERFSVELYF